MATVDHGVLRYLFSADFADGFRYEQNPEDRPIVAHVGSSFSDLKPLEDLHGPIVRFHLHWASGLTDGDHCAERVTVDLETGQFEIDGRIFFVDDLAERLPQNTKLRLVYFRRRKIHFNADQQCVGHETQYRLGWQATVAEGGVEKNVQAVIRVG